MYKGYKGLADKFGLVGGTPISSAVLPSSVAKITLTTTTTIDANNQGNNNKNNDNANAEILLAQLATKTISLQAATNCLVWLRAVVILAGASLIIGGAANAL